MHQQNLRCFHNLKCFETVQNVQRQFLDQVRGISSGPKSLKAFSFGQLDWRWKNFFLSKDNPKVPSARDNGGLHHHREKKKRREIKWVKCNTRFANG